MSRETRHTVELTRNFLPAPRQLRGRRAITRSPATEMQIPPVEAARGMAPTALLAGPAGVEGEEDEVADCEVGVSGGDGGAEGQDVAGAFVAEDAGEAEWRAEVAGAGD